MPDLRPVADRLAHGAALDHTAAHERILEAKRKLAARLYEAFPVTRHRASEAYETYGTATGLRGRLAAYTGGPLDWVVDSHIADPSRGFCNHHLTAWLGPEVAVPHFALAMGTIPELFVFIDLVPRSDLWVNTAELDAYHAGHNARFLEVTADPRFTPFVSREPYIRVAASPIALCLQGAPSDANIDLFMGFARDTLERWIAWVKEAPRVPAAERPALAARDRVVRRTVAERDPANVVAQRVFGAEATEKLVRLLWGAAKEEMS